MQTSGRVTATQRVQVRRRLGAAAPDSGAAASDSGAAASDSGAAASDSGAAASDSGAAVARTAPESDPAPVWPENYPEPELTPPRTRRERWLPSAWRGARTDPGRRGAIALAGVAAVAAVLAAVGVWRDRPVPQPVPALAPVVALAPAARSTGASPPGPLVISVAGSVRTPGLVTLHAGARVADAVAAAGGALPGTDLLTLNLAQPLHDGEQVLVGVPGVPGAPDVGSSGEAAGPDALVNLNTASAAELEALPGVGPIMAKAITDFRTKNGPFSHVDQLDDVSGFGAARMAQLRDRLTV